VIGCVCLNRNGGTGNTAEGWAHFEPKLQVLMTEAISKNSGVISEVVAVFQQHQDTGMTSRQTSMFRTIIEILCFSFSL
jgi:hypothetical protein